MAPTTTGPELRPMRILKSRAAFFFQSLAVPGKGVLDGEGGVAGPEGMVLVGEWCAEEGHDAVTGELVDRPLVLVDLIHEDLEAPVHDPVDLLGVELLGDGGEVRHVGKEDGDELALPFDRAPGGEDLLGQKLGSVGLGMGEIEGRGGGEGVAALAAELPVQRDRGAAGGTYELQPGTAFLAESHSFAVVKLTF